MRLLKHNTFKNKHANKISFHLNMSCLAVTTKVHASQKILINGKYLQQFKALNNKKVTLSSNSNSKRLSRGISYIALMQVYIIPTHTAVFHLIGLQGFLNYPLNNFLRHAMMPYSMLGIFNTVIIVTYR